MSQEKRALGTVKISIIILLSVVGGIICGRYIEQRAYREQFDIFTSILQRRGGFEEDKVSSTLRFIESNYVDSVSVDSIREVLMPIIAKQLDPHTVYIPPQDLKDMNEPLEGEFDGIGVTFNMATDTVVVINTIPSGPSYKVGIQGGDRIIEINDSLVAGRKIGQNNIIKQLRGERGTKVKLGIMRSGVNELLDFEVTRDAIPLHSIQSSLILEDSIGYIKMLQFARTTHRELIEAIIKLDSIGMTSLIIDLRENSGGYLDQAIMIANEFLPANNLIVYTEDRMGHQTKEYSNGKGRLKNMDIAVLINEGSASSSEILAGALQDNDVGVILGRRSFGKGLVQQQIPFNDGSAIRLTVARYYTPTGRSIQKSYTLGDSVSYDEDLYNRMIHNELFVADSIHFADSLRKVTPKGKVVYGGGGIMPDIFVPADTTNVSRYYIEVSAKNILYNFTTKYADKHREKINSITTDSELKELLDGDKSLFNDFIAYARAQGVTPRWSEINRSREIIEAQLRAYIGRNTPLDDEAFYRNIYPIDNVIVKAIETLKEGYIPTTVEEEQINEEETKI